MASGDISPHVQLYYQWPYRFDGWKNEMDYNLRTLGSLTQLAVIEKRNDPSSLTPNTGDRYLVESGATATVWDGVSDSIAVYYGNINSTWDEDDNGWEYHSVEPGWIIYNKNTGETHVVTGVDPLTTEILETSKRQKTFNIPNTVLTPSDEVKQFWTTPSGVTDVKVKALGVYNETGSAISGVRAEIHNVTDGTSEVDSEVERRTPNVSLDTGDKHYMSILNATTNDHTISAFFEVEIIA